MKIAVGERQEETNATSNAFKLKVTKEENILIKKEMWKN